MLYLFNNPNIKDKLNPTSLDSFNKIVASVGNQMFSDQSFMNVLLSLVKQMKTISLRPELQEKMNTTINGIKSLISSDLHDALKTEINTFLNKLL